MKTVQEYTDKFAIGLSMLCAIHCLLLPLLLIALPSISALQLQNEAFHFWMLATVIPTSLYALTIGCKKTPTLSSTFLGDFWPYLNVDGCFFWS